MKKTVQVAERTFGALLKTKKAEKVVQRATRQTNICDRIAYVQRRFFGESFKNEQKISSLKNGINEWLGEGTKMIKNKANDPIFMSKDNLRKVRFDFNNPHGDLPHMHFEQKFRNEWIDASIQHRIYPGG